MKFIYNNNNKIDHRYVIKLNEFYEGDKHDSPRYGSPYWW